MCLATLLGCSQFTLAQTSACCSSNCCGCCSGKEIKADSNSVKLSVIPSVIKLPMTEDTLPWLIFKNDSDFPIVYGHMYKVEYFDEKNKKWDEPTKKRGKRGAIFELILLDTPPYAEGKHALGSYYDVYNFKPGKYRIVKEIESENRKFVCYAEFMMKY